MENVKRVTKKRLDARVHCLPRRKILNVLICMTMHDRTDIGPCSPVLLAFTFIGEQGCTSKWLSRKFRYAPK